MRLITKDVLFDVSNPRKLGHLKDISYAEKIMIYNLACLAEVKLED